MHDRIVTKNRLYRVLSPVNKFYMDVGSMVRKGLNG
jgi:hypothetical protein